MEPLDGSSEWLARSPKNFHALRKGSNRPRVIGGSLLLQGRRGCFATLASRFLMATSRAICYLFSLALQFCAGWHGGKDGLRGSHTKVLRESAEKFAVLLDTSGQFTQPT